MKIPLSLIRSYLQIEEPLSDICQTLTLLGIEVDGIENETAPFSGVIAAEILSVKPHPQADKLQIAEVFDGVHRYQVVCGAKNCRAHLKTAFAKAGAVLFDSHGKEHRIEETSIRGTPSQGMLSSAHELGIPGDSEGILELPTDTKNGQDLIHLLWDPVLEISLTPNLGHCMSALGIARELSAALQKPLHRAKAHFSEISKATPFKASIVEKNLCSRYLGRLIEDVRIAPSPFWLQQVLRASGMNPINNAVDITNYILLKTGQPLHAFDADKIIGKEISVQTNDAPVSFTGLDGISRKIPPRSLLICDEQKPIALAGILGGENSAISETTRRVVLEAAQFDGMTLRKTARALSLRTESSQRFEKGIDAAGLNDALAEACALFAEFAEGKVVKEPIEAEGHPVKLREITLRPLHANKLLGTQLSLNEIESLLNRLGCKTHVKSENLRVTIPSYRNDLALEVDLVEEVARVYGYNNIEKKAPLYTSSPIPHDPDFLFERRVRRQMTGAGLQEILTCDLISPRLSSLLDIPSIPVLHAKSEEYSVLRSSLLPGVLEVIHHNLDQKNLSLSAFEIGRIYIPEKDRAVEVPMLAITFTGKARPHHWDIKPVDADFFDLKGTIEGLLEAFGITNLTFQPSKQAAFHPTRQATLHTNGLLIGTLGEIHPHLLTKLDIKQSIFYGEINLASLRDLAKTHVRMTQLPAFPSTERDWTLTLPEGTSFETLQEAIRSFHSPLLEKTEFIDLYIFEEEGISKRNATLRFTYRDPLKTLSFEEAEATHAKLVDHFKSSCDNF